MNKNFYFIVFLLLVFAIACKPLINAQQPEVQKVAEDNSNSVNDNVEEVGEDLSGVEDLTEDLSLEELDGLDKDLEELEKLNVE